MSAASGETTERAETRAPLRVEGARIVDAQGRAVRLTGFGLGGWMNMENFITGYPATEGLQRRAMLEAMGREAYDAFFDAFLDDFFADEDAAYIASLGVNCVRIAFHYRHFESDDNPGVLLEDGFRRLDRAIEACAAHGLYTVLDLHAAPGFHNQRWHSDNPTHVALFWTYREFQDRAIALWQALAARYRDNPWVAGYNVLNEPGDATNRVIGPFYERAHETIRAIDPDHILFLDGNRHGTQFAAFGEPLPNTVYTLHDYALAGFADSGEYPGYSRGQYVDRAFLLSRFLERSAYMRQTGTPIWVGEFGPVYSGDPERDVHRYRVLLDQLEIYAEHGAGWSLWTYKDIGLQGVVTARRDSPYLRLIAPILEKKARLGVDAWGTTDEGVRDVLGPIEELVAREYPGFDPAPFGQRQWIATLVRHILLAEPMVEDFARLFAGVSPQRARELAAAFRFAECDERTPLAAIVREFSTGPAPRQGPPAKEATG